MGDFLLIANASAGTADDEAVDTTAEVLARHGDLRRVATSGPDDLDHALAGAADRRLVVAGGDGSLHAVVEALHRRDRLADHQVALVPLGTGNDFARGTRIPLDPAQAAVLAATGTPHRIDLLVDHEGGVVVNNVHLGAGAEASRIGERVKESLGRIGVGKANLGILGYPLGVLVAGLRVAPTRLRVTVDEVVVADGRARLLMVSVGNGTSVGGGAELTPLAAVGDGAADVMLSRATGPASVLRYLIDLVRGRVHASPDVRYLRGTRIRVEAPGEARFWCAADGEIEGPMSARSWDLLPGALTMVLPAPVDLDTPR